MIHPGRYPSLPELLQDAFRQYPTQTAVIEAQRDRENVRLSYSGFRGRAMGIAAWMKAQGLGPDARVAIAMSNQAAWILCATAALHIGCTLVPLDSRLEPEGQQVLAKHAKADAIVAEWHMYRRYDDDISPLRLVVDAPEDADLRGGFRYEALPLDGQAPALAPRTRDDVACIVYSSGTGGQPKGCMLTHGNYLAQYQSLMETTSWEVGDRYFSILPTNHAIDFMCGFVASFCTGCTVVYQRTMRPEYIVSTMKRYRVNHMAVVPMILKAFERSLREKFDALEPGKAKVFGALKQVNRLFSRKQPNHQVSRWVMKPVLDAFGGELRTLYCGGAFLEASRADFFYELGIPVAIGYGLTEACTVLTLNTLKPYRGDSVGQAVPGVQLRIHQPDAHGVGEVWVKGPTVFKGYLDDPELTEAAFEDGWLKTGDLGWLDGAHHLHLVGRRKNMIVTAGGKNIYPEDIEAAFAEVPAEELVIFAKDYLFGAGGLAGEKLVAVVRAADDADRHHILADFRRRNLRLPEHKRVHELLWWNDEFPRTTSMKIKRHLLAEDLGTRASSAQCEDAQ